MTYSSLLTKRCGTPFTDAWVNPANRLQMPKSRNKAKAGSKGGETTYALYTSEDLSQRTSKGMLTARAEKVSRAAHELISIVLR